VNGTLQKDIGLMAGKAVVIGLGAVAIKYCFLQRWIQ
jgi:hypothetical protein